MSSSSDKTVCLWKVEDETRLEFKGGHTGSVDCVTMVTEDHFVSGSQDGSVALWSAQKKKPIALVRRAHGYDLNDVTHNNNNSNNNNNNNNNKNNSDNTSSLFQHGRLPHGTHRVSALAPTANNDTWQQYQQYQKQQQQQHPYATPCWINSISCIPYSDLVASGSNSGYVQLWKANYTKAGGNNSSSLLSPVALLPVVCAFLHPHTHPHTHTPHTRMLICRHDAPHTYLRLPHLYQLNILFTGRICECFRIQPREWTTACMRYWSGAQAGQMAKNTSSKELSRNFHITTTQFIIASTAVTPQLHLQPHMTSTFTDTTTMSASQPPLERISFSSNSKRGREWRVLFFLFVVGHHT